MSISYVVSNSGTITLYFKGKVYNVNTEHQSYTQIKEAVSKQKEEGLHELLNPVVKLERQLNSYPATTGIIKVEAGQVLFEGEPVHGVVVDKILQFARESFDFQPLVNFMSKLQHVSMKSVDNLYRFLEHNQHPITPDGCFLAYKRVCDDYMDMHKRKFDNTPGKVVQMPRWQVEQNENITCAAGLHVAALRYAMHDYNSGSGRLVVCKVDPADVVSVPTDYNSMKMRVCKYEVIQDYTNEIKQEEVVARVTPPVADMSAGEPDYYSKSGNPDVLPDDDDDFDDEDDDIEDEDECFDCGYELDDCRCYDEDSDEDDDFDDDEPETNNGGDRVLEDDDDIATSHYNNGGR